MAKGWITIHRQIQDCTIWLDPEPFDRRSAWIDLLLLVNHADKEIIFNGNLVTIGRGQYLTSIRKLAVRWNWSRDRVSRYLKLLEELQMIKKESDNSRTLITVEKYSVYQDMPDSNDDSNKAAYADTLKATRKAQTTMNNNDNNVINNKRPQKHARGEYSHVKLTDEEFERLAKDYGADKRDEAIKFLDEYIEQKPSYKNNNHNLCLRKWVFKAVEEHKGKNIPKNSFNSFERAEYDLDALEKILAGG